MRRLKKIFHKWLMPPTIRSNKELLSASLILILCGCINKDCYRDVDVIWSPANIAVKKNGKNIIMDYNNTLNPTIFSEVTKAYVIDTINCSIYINSFNSQIKRYDLSNGKLLDSVSLSETPNMSFDTDFQLNIIDSTLILKSNRNLLIYSLNLVLKVNVLDSVFEADPELKTQVYGFWYYKVIGDSLSLNFKVRSDAKDQLLNRIIFYPLK